MSDTFTIPTTEPVVVSFKSVERTGEIRVAFDDLSSLAVDGGYDALRIRSALREDGQDDAIADGILAEARPRALEAAKVSLAKAGSLSSAAFKPGSDAITRRQARACLKGAIRALRVARSK